MKNLTKKLMALVMILSFVLSTNSVAIAATQHTTGLKDGLYNAQTKADPNLMNTYYKMSVVVEGGKVTTGSFILTSTGYPGAITINFAAAAPTKETKAFIENTCPEVEDYATQLINKGDGVLVTKYSKAASDSTVFQSFNELWKDVVKQAGGKIVSGTAKVTSVSLNKKSVTVKIGSSYTLKAVVKPSSESKNIVWTSSNSKVVKVSASGKITGVTAGTATITVKTKDGSHKATCKVTVKAK